MKTIRILPEPNEPSEVEDCERIVRIFEARGYDISILEAYQLWQRYSDSMCAGWMRLNEGDDEVFANVTPYFEVED